MATENKNCPNCGAVYTLDDVKCPYCGTLYYDLSAIDFTDGKPVFLKFRVPYGNTYAHITQCAVPQLDSIEFTNDTTSCVDCMGNVIKRFQTGGNITTNIQFVAMQYGKKNELLNVCIE